MSSKFLFFLVFSIAASAQQLPKTKKIPTQTTLHGKTFTDDYSWLEDMDSEAVRSWVAEQNVAADAHLDSVGKMGTALKKIREYDKLSSNSLPIKKGRYFYSIYKSNSEKSIALGIRANLDDPIVPVFTQNTFYGDNKATYITNYYPSKHSQIVACAININGSDVTEVRFADLNRKAKYDDVLTGVKSNIAWSGKRGVFYKKNNNTSRFATDSTYQLFYHKLGTPQSDDQLIFDTTKDQSRFSFFTTIDKLFIVEESEDESYKNYYISDIATNNFFVEKIIDRDTTGFEFHDYDKGRIIFSSKEYEWGDVRSFRTTDRRTETVIIPQLYQHLLVNTYFVDGHIFCKYRKDGRYYLSAYGEDGTFIRKFDLEGMDFTVRFYDSTAKTIYVTYSSYVLPYQNVRHNLETGESQVVFNAYIKAKPTVFPLDYFETKFLNYKSRDNKNIPITIIHKKGIALDGNNPALLNAYGGFGVVSGPRYDTGLLHFLEQGGVFAFASIRGGGEKGLSWHLDGKGMKKINSINDFVDAAEFLISEKYTTASKLAITGGSHGALVVGGAMVQRPDLFKVVIPEMGKLDMLVSDRYTVGKFHLDEYGNPENEAEFNMMMSYSPYGNIREDVNYPTTLIITAENDDRVPPLHSYKFAARLQGREAQKNPVLLRTLKDAGHRGATSGYLSRLEQDADFYNFILYHLTN